jgi:hypothetical protein
MLEQAIKDLVSKVCAGKVVAGTGGNYRGIVTLKAARFELWWLSVHRTRICSVGTALMSTDSLEVYF